MSAGIGFNGLISGLDTGLIIEALLQADRAPLTTLANKREDIVKRNEAVSTIKSRLSALQGSLTSLKLESSLNGRSVSLSGADSAAVSVSANSKAALGSYTIGVERLATATRTTSAAPIGQAIDAGEIIEDANFSTALTSGSFKINGVAISIDTAADTLNDVINRINSSGAGVTASIVNDSHGRANILQIDANAPGGAIQLGAGSDTSNFLSATKIDAAPRVGDAITASGGLGGLRTSVPLNQADLTTPCRGSWHTDGKRSRHCLRPGDGLSQRHHLPDQWLRLRRHRKLRLCQRRSRIDEPDAGRHAHRSRGQRRFSGRRRHRRSSRPGARPIGQVHRQRYDVLRKLEQRLDGGPRPDADAQGCRRPRT